LSVNIPDPDDAKATLHTAIVTIVGLTVAFVCGWLGHWVFAHP
jgi:hypothetical protein